MRDSSGIPSARKEAATTDKKYHNSRSKQRE
jgi:hypothetical protein